MTKLPQLSDPDLVRALEKLGFTVRRQHGSHIISGAMIRSLKPSFQITGTSTAARCAPFCVRSASRPIN